MRPSLRVAGAVVLLSLGVMPMARAASVDVSIGPSVTASQRWTQAAFMDATGGTHRSGDVHWQPEFTLGVVARRGTHADRLDHTVYIGGAGVRLVDWWQRAFFSFQLGVAGGRTDALSSAGQFISTLGWQAPHYQVMLRHISNGKVFGGKNLGETMLLVGFRI